MLKFHPHCHIGYRTGVVNFQKKFSGPFGLLGPKKKTEDRTEPLKTERTETGPDRLTALVSIQLY